MSVNTHAPSGTQVRIAHGEHAATITEVGAAVREYAVGGRPVFTPFAEDEVAPAFNGAVLLPWPNRLRDGAYEVDGTAYQVPVSEPDRGTALHGLACWQRWVVVEHAASAATLELHLPPSPGYPFDLATRVTYSLDDAGLRVHVRTTNVGAATAPYGIGFHPWLSADGANLDECTLRLDAATRVTTDERLLPTGTEPAASPTDVEVACALI